MARSVEEWAGKTDDTPIPDRVRVRTFARYRGVCCACGVHISAGMRWDCDHVVSLINGGKNRESNLQVLCELCHRGKTRADTAIKAKVYAIKKRHLGLKKSKGRPMAGTKASGWKHKIGGGWERR